MPGYPASPRVYTYLRFITERWNPISAAIRFETRSWASHVELVRLRPDCMEVVGCRFARGLNRYPYDTRRVTREEWYTAPGAWLAWSWMVNHIGQKYDLSAIFGIALDANFHDDDRDICSESVCRAFEETGNPLLSMRGTATWRITPRDLLLSDKITLLRRVI